MWPRAVVAMTERQRSKFGFYLEPPIGIEPMTYALREGLEPSTAVQTVTPALLARLLSPPASIMVQGRC
jgi:hypothetical protein